MIHGFVLIDDRGLYLDKHLMWGHIANARVFEPIEATKAVEMGFSQWGEFPPVLIQQAVFDQKVVLIGDLMPLDKGIAG